VALGNALLSERRIAKAKAKEAYADATAAKSFGLHSPAALGAESCLRLIDCILAESRLKLLLPTPPIAGSHLKKPGEGGA
jgi:hypothetical protein